jgi:hypothetical protein
MCVRSPRKRRCFRVNPLSAGLTVGLVLSSKWGRAYREKHQGKRKEALIAFILNHYCNFHCIILLSCVKRRKLQISIHKSPSQCP